jgi:hypothetical protein
MGTIYLCHPYKNLFYQYRAYNFLSKSRSLIVNPGAPEAGEDEEGEGNL